jgi:hypothetical protein
LPGRSRRQSRNETHPQISQMNAEVKEEPVSSTI